MQYRVPDIKTVDGFFGIFSDQKLVLKQMDEMRKIRDDIMLALGMTDTKAKADRLFLQASQKMIAASDYDRDSKAFLKSSRQRLAAKEKVFSDKVFAWDADSGAADKKFKADRAEFDEMCVIAEKEMTERKQRLKDAEDELAAAEAKIAKREAAHTAYVKDVQNAVAPR